MKTEKKYVITESQLKTVIKDVIKEQGLYGNTSDVVDYDLPEYLSDVIILKDLESMNDVENSVKELHKRVMRLEKGLDTAGSHQKAYGTGLDYSEKNKRDISNLERDIEDKEDSQKRDDELKRDIEALQQMMQSADKKDK
jgi:predicted RNase H-like nuclease (RuvC/YqgF family)